MLNLKVHTAPSLIKQQLQPAFDELVRFEYLSDWRIERTTSRRLFKIIFMHGAKFHRDRKRALAEKARVEEPEIIAESEAAALPVPGRLDFAGDEQPAPKRGRVRRQPGPAPKAAPTRLEHSEHKLEIQSVELIDTQTSDNPKRQNAIDELSARGLMPAAASNLVAGMADEALEHVVDVCDYFDDIRKTREVGPGLLYRLVKDGGPLPSAFVTRRERSEREAAKRRHDDLRRLKDEIQVSYDEHCQRVMERYVAEEVPLEEFERKVMLRKAEIQQQGGLWESKNGQQAENFARIDVRRVGGGQGRITGVLSPPDPANASS